MRRTTSKRRRAAAWAAVFAAALVAALLAACARPPATGPVRPHVALDASGQPFHAAFNADLGMVRIVMLPSPT